MTSIGVPLSNNPAKLAQKSRNALIGIAHQYRSFDRRTVVGLGLLLFAMALLSNTPVGVLGWMASHGVPTKGYAYLLAFGGGCILRWPKSRLYGFFVMTFFPYLAASVFYFAEAGLNYAPFVAFLMLFFLALSAE